jgi:hypothetical protein
MQNIPEGQNSLRDVLHDVFHSADYVRKSGRMRPMTYSSAYFPHRTADMRFLPPISKRTAYKAHRAFVLAKTGKLTPHMSQLSARSRTAFISAVPKPAFWYSLCTAMRKWRCAPAGFFKRRDTRGADNQFSPSFSVTRRTVGTFPEIVVYSWL